jgi:hypothetical protein
MSEIEDIKSYFKKHPAIIISIVFLFSSATGILYDIIYYLNFDVNVLNFTNTEDYLISWLRDRNLFLNYFFVLLFFYVVFKTHTITNTDKYLKQSPTRIQKLKRREQIYMTSLGFIIFAHSAFVANYYHNSFYTTIILFIIYKIFDTRVFIFKTKLEGKFAYLPIARTMIYFILIWGFATILTANSTSRFMNDSEKYNCNIQMKNNLIVNAKLIGKNSTDSFFELPNDSLIRIISNREIISYDFIIK